MKKHIIYLMIIFSATFGLLSGCSNTGDATDEQSMSAEDENSVVETIDNQSAPMEDEDSGVVSEVELDRTYTTRFGEVNQITVPAFSFDYPAEWKIESDEVTPTSEEVVLSNDAGATITYWQFSEMRDLTGRIRDINDVNVEWVSDASFVPGYVQATDYSDLGKFVVAKIEVTGRYDVLGGGDYMEAEEKNIRYALLPEDQLGEQQECIIPGLPTFAFWYAGHISMIAHTNNEDFTEQEVREVIAILSSFREGV